MVSLRKGGNVSLTKEAGGSLRKVIVGLGWDARITDGQGFDLDAVAFICGANGKVREDSDFIFFNNMSGAGGAVNHLGDNTTGEGDGDDEQISLQLDQMPADVAKIVICVIIYDAENRNQNFGMVSNALTRVVNDSNGQVLADYDLSEDMSMETSMIFAEIYRHRSDWKFKAIGQGFSGGLGPLAQNYGVSV